MSTNLISKMFEDNKEVRFIEINNKPWIVLKDLLHAMGTTTTTTAVKTQIIQTLGEEYVESIPVPDARNCVQDTAIITRDAAMFIVSRGNTDASKRLNRWLFGEVLPDILDTGNYIGNPQSQVVGNLTVDQLAAIINDSVKKALPKVEFKNHGVFQPFSGFDVATLVEMLNEKYNIKASVKDGYDLLVLSGYVNHRNRNLPTAYGVKSEIVGCAVTPIVYSDNNVGISRKIVVKSEYAEHFVDELFNFVSNRISDNRQLN